MARFRRRTIRAVAVGVWKSPLVRRLVPLSMARRIDRRVFTNRQRQGSRRPPPNPTLHLPNRDDFVQNPEQLLISVNPNLHGLDGHFFAIDQALVSAASARSIAFASLACLHIEPRIVEAHPWMIPVFSDRFEERHLGDLDVARELAALPAEFEQGLATMRRFVDAPITVFWYQANLEYVMLEGPFADPEVHHHLHLFFAYAYDFDDRRQVNHVRTLLERAATLTNVTIHVGTSALADHWQEHLGVQLSVLPSAPSLLPPLTKPPDRNMSLILCPGTSSRGKGFADTLGLIQLVLDDSPEARDWELVVRDESERLEAPARRLLARAADHPRVQLLDGVVTGPELTDLYRRTGVVVLPYRPEPFALRSSGSFTDAVVSGAPIVAADGTLAAVELARLRIGSTYEAGNVEDLVRAINEASAHEDSALASKQRTQLVEANSIDRLLSNLVESHPPEPIGSTGASNPG